MKNKLLISFSGGETSAYMTVKILEQFKDWYDVKIVFANTGEENEETLQFVEQCDKHFGLGVVWVEAVFNPKHRAGTRARVVSFESASRNGEPFEEMIKKHGIPNTVFKHCSKELKRHAIEAYLRSVGWKKREYKTAIGIRSDEMDRISEAKDRVLWYPLVEWGIDKPSVNRFWREMPFRLNLKGYQGNCKVCWKKTLRKHLTIAKENPSAFDNFKKWEEKYENHIPPTQKARRISPIRFFRKNLTVSDIMNLSKQPFELADDDSIKYNEKESVQFGFEDVPLDISDGCVESCEVF